jgi:hypothetical protein
MAEINGIATKKLYKEWMKQNVGSWKRQITLKILSQSD